MARRRGTDAGAAVNEAARAILVQLRRVKKLLKAEPDNADLARQLVELSDRLIAVERNRGQLLIHAVAGRKTAERLTENEFERLLAAMGVEGRAYDA